MANPNHSHVTSLTEGQCAYGNLRALLVDTTLYTPVTPFFLEPLQELSIFHTFLDEGSFLRPLGRSIIHKALYRALRRSPLSSSQLNRTLLEAALQFRPNVVLVVKGAYIKPSVLHQIKEMTKAILINYATDDPFNPKVTTPDLVKAIPCYDFYISTKSAIVEDLKAAGARAVSYLPFGYKSSLHFPEAPVSTEEKQRFAADVAFIGVADDERLSYIKPLTRIKHLSLALYGPNWTRYNRLKPFVRGPAVGRDYRLALGGAKIALGLLRKANRDGHTMRSFEIPACGAFMLAERTDEHLEILREGRDAEFFSTADELVEKIRYYLQHDSERQRIAASGHQRITEGGHTYAHRLCQILSIGVK
jgi:spore maturation protein CgeB